MSNDTRGTEPDNTDAAAPDALEDAAAETPATEADADSTPESANAGDAEYEMRRSPALIATAVALPVALVVGLIVMGVLANRHHSRDPLALGSVPAPAAAGPECTALLPALPDKIGDYTTAELMQPAPPATHAWQLPDGGDAIVVRCGLDRPLEFTKSSPLQVVNGVNWFELRDQTSGVTSGTWWAVDRGTYIALTMPDNAGATPLQEVSEAIKKAMSEKPMDPNPIPN
ncbi:DUF3515 domain-containing protein [Nocardia sp. NPDC005746]|uniref:DUF3515 domain-containing protein n=1 Tax=Nocardia sp. NPDC005746 TaxID=3157062 RepID=UPI0033EB8144